MPEGRDRLAEIELRPQTVVEQDHRYGFARAQECKRIIDRLAVVQLDVDAAHLADERAQDQVFCRVVVNEQDVCFSRHDRIPLLMAGVPFVGRGGAKRGHASAATG
ncbi:hypothetical protein D3C71_1820330 [compost metagenome]